MLALELSLLKMDIGFVLKAITISVILIAKRNIDIRVKLMINTSGCMCIYFTLLGLIGCVSLADSSVSVQALVALGFSK